MSVIRGFKTIAVLSIIFGCVTLIVSSWTFGSIITHNEKYQTIYKNFTASKPTIYKYSKFHGEGSNTKLPAYWAKLHDMTMSFQTLIIIFTWITNIGALVQIGAGILVLVQLKQEILTATKYFVGSHLIVFILLLISFFYPLSQNRENDSSHSIETFNDEIMAEINQIDQVGINYLHQDVHAYYFALVVNICMIFTVIILNCCLLFLESKKQSYERV